MTPIERYIDLCQQRGLTANTALLCYRGAGGTVRRAEFLATWRRLLERRAAAGAAA